MLVKRGLLALLLMTLPGVVTAGATLARSASADPAPWLFAAAQDGQTGAAPTEAEQPRPTQPDADTDRSERRTVKGHRSERVAVGQKIALSKAETAREVVVVLGSATIEGTVEHSVVVVFGEAFIGGKVGGELVSVFSDVELGPNAEVQGKVVTVGRPLKVDPAAKLTVSPIEVPIGDLGIRFESFKRNILEGVLLRPLPPHLKWAWLLAACFFLVHLAVAVALAKPVQACARTLAEKPVRSLLVGVLVAVLSLPLLAMLSVTVIGPPILLCTLLVATLLGKVGVYTATGGQIGRQLRLRIFEAPLTAFLLGTTVFYLLYMVPVLGWLTWLVITPLGTGAAVLAAAAALSREGRSSEAAALVQVPTPVEQAGSSTALKPSEASGLAGPDARVGSATGASETAAAAPEPIASTPPALSLGRRSRFSPAELATLERAGFWPRFAAALLDFIPLAILSAPLGGFPAFVFLAIAYHASMWVWREATLGGVILGLRVLRLDGRPMDWPTAVVRSLSSLVSLFPFGLGFFWASWSEERQSWHDIIAGTTVVKLRRREPLL